MHSNVRVAFILASLITAVACAGPEPDPVPQPSATPRSAAERAAIEEVLFQLENDWIDVNFSKDTSALEEILAEDLVYTLDTGEVIGKQEMIENFANDPIIYQSIDVSDMSAHWYGDDVVLVIGGATDTGTDADGNPIQSTGRWTNVFMEREGRWQCVIGHFTVIDD